MKKFLDVMLVGAIGFLAGILVSDIKSCHEDAALAPAGGYRDNKCHHKKGMLFCKCPPRHEESEEFESRDLDELTLKDLEDEIGDLHNPDAILKIDDSDKDNIKVEKVYGNCSKDDIKTVLEAIKEVNRYKEGD